MSSPAPPVTLPLRGVVALALDKQHLGVHSAGDDVVAVVDDLVGLHATVALSPFVQLRARMPAFAAEQLNAVLDECRAAKVACMRRTLFIQSIELVPIVLAATRELRLRGRDRFLAASGLTPHRYAQIADRVAAALAGRALDGRRLRDAVGAGAPLSPVIIVMCDEGRLIRWSGAGGWQSARPRYRRADEALPSVRLDAWDERAARRELVARYVRRCAPRDAAASLLPVLDPYLQGYRDRARFIDTRHRRFVIDSSGNATSVILLDGRAAGVWDLVSGRPPELRLCFFDAVHATARRRVHALASDMAGFLTGESARITEVDRMTPLTDRTAGRFQSPLSDRRDER